MGIALDLVTTFPSSSGIKTDDEINADALHDYLEKIEEFLNDLPNNVAITPDISIEDMLSYQVVGSVMSVPPIRYASASQVIIDPCTVWLDNTTFAEISTPLTMTLTSAWIDTGLAEAASSTYYIYIVGDDLAVFSLNGTSPAGHTHYLKIGQVYNDASKDINQFEVITYNFYQYYERLKLPVNSGGLSSIEYVSSSSVKVIGNNYFVLNNGQRVFLHADTTIDMATDLLGAGEGASTIYNIYVIQPTTSPEPICKFDSAASPTGYSNYIHIGYIWNNGSSNFDEGSLRTLDTHTQYIKGHKKNLREVSGIATIANGTSSVTVTFATIGIQDFNNVYKCHLTPQSYHWAVAAAPFIYGYADASNVYIYSHSNTNADVNIQWTVQGD